MKIYVIAEVGVNDYWTGKKYTHQGEEFLIFDDNPWKAKSWQSKKRAETAFNKLSAFQKQGLEVRKLAIQVTN